jgi:hypothetical protein
MLHGIMLAAHVTTTAHLAANVPVISFMVFEHRTAISRQQPLDVLHGMQHM